MENSKIIKIAAISTLALMTVFNPIVASASSHSYNASITSTKKKHKSTKKNTKIKVNTKKNKIYLYRKVKGKWYRVASGKCCTGKNKATPTGKFQAYSKEPSFTKENLDYNYVTYFSSNCAIHSTPYDGEKYNNSSLGYSRSHGCVRVKPEVAEWIYKNIEEGTTIEIE